MSRPAAILFLWGIAAACLWVQCTKGPEDVAGSGSTMPNPAFIKGMVKINGGNAGEGVSVTVFKITAREQTGFDWTLIDSTVTDSNGEYGIDSVIADYVSLVFEKDPYKAFSGYLDLPVEGTTLVLDTIYLKPTISILGMVQQTDAFRILISFVGMADQVMAQTDSIEPSANKFFILDKLPLSNYIIELVLNYGRPDEDKIYLSLPAYLAASKDTSYVDSTYGVNNQISIKDKVFELTNDHLKLTCLVVEN